MSNPKIRITTYRNNNEIDAADPKFVIVFATVDSSGSSQDFLRDQFESLKDTLLANDKLLIYHLQLSIPSVILSQHLISLALPCDLSRYIQWYPTIAIFKSKSWIKAMQGERLKGVVFDGIMQDDKLMPASDINFQMDHILEWINAQINDSNFNSEIPKLISSLNEKLQILSKEKKQIKRDMAKLNQWLAALTVLQSPEFCEYKEQLVTV